MSTPPLTREEKDARLYAMLAHLTALSLFLGVPFGNILGPLIVWLIKKDQMPFVNDQGKESLNFQISMTIYLAIAGILSFALVGIPLLIAVAVADLILTIIASIQASNGVAYRYPLTIQFLK